MTERQRVCPKCQTGLDEWVCIQEGNRFGVHTLRCFACGFEKAVD
jgi:predicted amidophosphoribosyltransferase